MGLFWCKKNFFNPCTVFLIFRKRIFWWNCVWNSKQFCTKVSLIILVLMKFFLVHPQSLQIILNCIELCSHVCLRDFKWKYKSNCLGVTTEVLILISVALSSSWGRSETGVVSFCYSTSSENYRLSCLFI